MEEEDKITGYLRSLYQQPPDYLRELEKKALADHVPIIRKQTQEVLRFLLRQKRPVRLLELGTAVGFSASFFAEYMPENAKLLTVEKVPVRIVEAKKNLKASPYADRITMIVGDALQVLQTLNGKAGKVLKSLETAGSIPENAEEYPDGRCVKPAEAKRNESQLGVFYPGSVPERVGQVSSLLPFPGCVTRNQEPDGWKDEIFCWKPEMWGTEPFDFIFLDAAKAQYMSYLPEILDLLEDDALFITDNILQEGSVADSKYSIPRRDRTIHMRMREYLYEITHSDSLDTVLLSEGDGLAVSRKIRHKTGKVRV